MKRKLTPGEWALLLACVALTLLAVLGPAVGQPAHYHDFADQRVGWGVPHAMDVATNLPFALWGVVGLVLLRGLRTSSLSTAQRHMATLFFAGLALTSLASGWYHWQPDNAGLALDRLGMAVAFAGLLGLVAAGRISARAGTALGWGVLLAAALSVTLWTRTANVLPWAVVQFGGMGLVLWLATRRPVPGALPVSWAVVILLYAIAKLLEAMDPQVYALTTGMVSGHSLKHVVASLAAWPVWGALRGLKKSVQNPVPVKTMTPIVMQGRVGTASSRVSTTIGRHHVR